VLVLLKLAPGQEVCANVVHRYSLAEIYNIRQKGPSVQLQAGKARPAVQLQDVPAEERIAVQIRARSMSR
jgi:hypothetical protein